MISLHATQKLFYRLSLDQDGLLPSSERTAWMYEKPVLDINPLSGWHAHQVTLHRRQCILMAHDLTRFPLVLPAVKKIDLAELNDRFVDALMNTLLKCGAEEFHLEAVHRCVRPLKIDVQCSRSVQGTLRIMKDEIECCLDDSNQHIADITGYRMGARLADTPRTVQGKECKWPKKEMLTLLASLGNDAPTLGWP